MATQAQVIAHFIDTRHHENDGGDDLRGTGAACLAHTLSTGPHQPIIAEWWDVWTCFIDNDMKHTSLAQALIRELDRQAIRYEVHVPA